MHSCEKLNCVLEAGGPGDVYKKKIISIGLGNISDTKNPNIQQPDSFTTGYWFYRANNFLE